MREEDDRLANERFGGKKKNTTQERESARGLADVLPSSGEVHGVLGVIVDLNRLGQRLRVPAITLARHVAAFSTARQTHRIYFEFVRNGTTTKKIQETNTTTPGPER